MEKFTVNENKSQEYNWKIWTVNENIYHQLV